jgi:hypothetical protein
VGLAFIGMALLLDEAGWQDALLGLVVLSASVIALVALRARWAPTAARHPPARPRAQGGSVRSAVPDPGDGRSGVPILRRLDDRRGRDRAGGCEVTALSNALPRRDDEVGCVLFAPVDLAERRARWASGSAVADHWT